MVPITDYERERQERIAKNKAILASLDIPTARNGNQKRGTKSDAKPTSVKRKRRASPSSRNPTEDSEELPSFTRRTSARLQQRVISTCFPYSLHSSLVENTKKAIMRIKMETCPITRRKEGVQKMKREKLLRGSPNHRVLFPELGWAAAR